ncbi:MAG: divergent polysaccharide deacetylase family protein [Candidatus Acidiferrales bacterium]
MSKPRGRPAPLPILSRAAFRGIAPATEAANLRLQSFSRLAVCAGVALMFMIAGCAEKSLSKSEKRRITIEVVAAAQRVTAHKSEITIRPQASSPWDRATGYFPADNVYVTLGTASEAASLHAALGDIARRHRMTLSENVSGGVLRFELGFRGQSVDVVHAVIPAEALTRNPEPRGSAAGRGQSAPQLVLIIDDLGYDRAAADALLALPFPLTVSVIPHLPLSSEVAEEAYRRGEQVMLHLPMQSMASGVKQEDVELRPGMNAAEVDSILAGMLATVPHAAGVNNHEGSLATSDATLMQELMPVLHERGLFFIDSRTSAATVAYDVAEKSGVAAASRKVFLDDVPARAAILAQLDLAARDAQRDGFAIAIGHPRPDTIAALRDGVPRIQARGIRLAFASDVVH